MTTYNGWTMPDWQAESNLLDRQARALLKNSCVTLAGKEFDYLEDLNPADVAYILDSDCTCTRHFAGFEVVETTCERCRLEQYRQDMEADLTDLLELAVKGGVRSGVFPIGLEEEFQGINSREQLAAAYE